MPAPSASQSPRLRGHGTPSPPPSTTASPAAPNASAPSRLNVRRSPSSAMPSAVLQTGVR